MNVSWNTTKTTNGFDWRVYEIVTKRSVTNGHHVDFVTLAEGTRKTRAQAKGLAQRWVRYYKAAA